ncbi:hypothetical protein FNF29_08434 [Cafeteria roenbergensis]|uniref:E3 ubiquitin-protein ligase n=1 Tax=Cafeteria roenbergensis TaxID=33653 RepID=A0A5A8BZ97_CAFRO|nr:hypothetical protein FNF29_08434 [Cafeteria roenbergensis]|eukprot:KAA0145677.1 hypothetical protein FNF29_08434 [Cafeteria roenbergensis]
MCDVGDAEAIDPVCWPARYRRFVDGSQAAPDPIDALDEGTRERLTVVSKAAVAFVARTMAELRNAHEVEATVARLAAGGTAGGMHPEADAPFHGGADPSEGGVVVSPRPWTTLSLGAREDDEGAAAKRPRQASKPAGPEDQAECSVAVVLHDDDYHTYDDVANALAAAGIAHTMDLTGRVDEEGEAEVAFGSLERGQAAAAGTTSSDGGAAPPAGSPAAAAEASAAPDADRAQPASRDPLALLFQLESRSRRTLRAALSDLYAELLRRPSFRRPFAAAFASSYRQVALDWVRGVGSSKGSFHDQAVQALTTPSIARALAASAASPRLVAAVLRDAMECSAGKSVPEVEVDPASVIIAHMRYSRVGMDLTYLAGTPGASQAFIRDEEAVRCVAQALGRLHGGLPFTRKSGEAIAFADPKGLKLLNAGISLGHCVSSVLEAAFLGPAATEEEQRAAEAAARVLPSMREAGAAALRQLRASRPGADAAVHAPAMGVLAPADVSRALHVLTKEVMGRVRLASLKGTGHPASRGMEERVDAAAMRARETAIQTATMMGRLGIALTPELRAAALQPVRTELVRAGEPVRDVAAAPRDVVLERAVETRGEEAQPPREFQSGGALVSSMSLKAADLDKIPVSMLVPMHTALGSAAQMAAVAFAGSPDAGSVLEGIRKAAAELPGLPAAALIEHPLRALIVAGGLAAATCVSQ